MTERTVGKNEPQYALILGQIAETLVNSKRPKEAIGYLDRAIAIQSAKLGRDHFQTLTLRLTKCDAEHGSGATKAAIATCKSALAAAERTLGPESPLVFVFLAHTGIVLTDGHEAREAHALFERALQLGAADISDVYYVQMLDAKALWAMGKHAPAIARAQKARDGFATLGDAKADQRKDAEAWLANHRR